MVSLCFILLIMNLVELSTARWDGSPCGMSGFSKFIGQISAQLLYCSGGRLPSVVYLPMHRALQSLLRRGCSWLVRFEVVVLEIQAGHFRININFR